jgi:hypothetical protein
MKIGFYCESPADQAALRIFTEGILGETPEPISMDLEGHGFSGILKGLDGVFRGVHYNSDAEALVIVIDRDDSETHDPSHNDPGQFPEDCRYCEIRRIIERARKQLKPRTGREPVRVAIGLAVPAMEAWYLVGTNHQVEEKVYQPESKYPQPPRGRLKELVYGTTIPSLELETERAETAARRIIANLAAIENAFPIGFGLMAQQIRSWKT